jgi:3-oxoacyl-[acyl-carrier protein] reductase
VNDQPVRRAIVSGGSGDIGGAICRELARRGMFVYVHGNASPERADAVAAAIRNDGGAAEAIVFDLCDGTAARAALERAQQDGPIGVVVHNAGVHDDAPMAGMGEAQWKHVIDVSLHGFFHLTQPLLLAMARARFGRVVALSSVAAVLGNRGQANYAAAKAGLHGAVRSLAREMASRGIAANVVAPGVIAGRMTDATFTAEQVKALVPAARAGTAEEVASLVGFLCSEQAGYINGQVIGINGGMG